MPLLVPPFENVLALKIPALLTRKIGRNMEFWHFTACWFCDSNIKAKHKQATCIFFTICLLIFVKKRYKLSIQIDAHKLSKWNQQRYIKWNINCSTVMFAYNQYSKQERKYGLWAWTERLTVMLFFWLKTLFPDNFTNLQTISALVFKRWK